MKLHGNAALSLNGRRRLVRMVLEEGRSIATAAEAAGVSERTCPKWVARYRADGEPGLLDRSSAPGRVHNRTDEQLVQLLGALRRLRFTAPSSPTRWRCRSRRSQGF
jgi:transposase